MQFSIQRISASQRKDNSTGDAFNELIDALLNADVIPYIRDIHLAYDHDQNSHLQALAYQLGHPILGEADRRALSTLFEYSPELEQHYCDQGGAQRSAEAVRRLPLRRAHRRWQDASGPAPC